MDKLVKNSASKDLTFIDFDDVNNAPETSEGTNFGSIDHKVFIVK